MRKKVIAGNWKMYKTPDEAKAFVEALLPLVKGHTRNEIVICPSATSLSTVVETAKGSNISVGAQTVHWLDEGAYTGQTSPKMLTAIGVTHAILGHSEPRTHDSETDERVNLKLKACVKHGIHAIVCIGEQLEERQQNLTRDVLLAQLAGGLAGVTPDMADNFVIAYEPVWAIGTGLTATPEQAEEAHTIIRTALAQHLGEDVAAKMRILYGGSVKPGNIAALLAMPNIDGALIGGASLVAEDFAKMVKYEA
ncbi:MAG: triose-phosphate isomerase [Acidobacteria bacterium]|nr:triose-phosphate isomerase [Acidobacteriota bacterium]